MSPGEMNIGTLWSTPTGAGLSPYELAEAMRAQPKHQSGFIAAQRNEANAIPLGVFWRASNAIMHWDDPAGWSEAERSRRLAQFDADRAQFDRERKRRK